MLPVNPEAIGVFGRFATVICFGLFNGFHHNAGLITGHQAECCRQCAVATGFCCHQGLIQPIGFLNDSGTAEITFMRYKGIGKYMKTLVGFGIGISAALEHGQLQGAAFRIEAVLAIIEQTDTVSGF